jgi:hypothetical protein
VWPPRAPPSVPRACCPRDGPSRRPCTVSPFCRGSPTDGSLLRPPTGPATTSSRITAGRGTSPNTQVPVPAASSTPHRRLPFGRCTPPRAACPGEFTPPRRPKTGSSPHRLPPRPLSPTRHAAALRIRCHCRRQRLGARNREPPLFRMAARPSWLWVGQIRPGVNRKSYLFPKDFC